MSQFTISMTKLHLGPDRVMHMLRAHARPLVLACGLAGALLVWSMPAASEGRCMIAKQAALGWQAAISLSIALTVLTWYSHKPVVQRVRSLRQRFARD